LLAPLLLYELAGYDDSGGQMAMKRVGLGIVLLCWLASCGGRVDTDPNSSGVNGGNNPSKGAGGSSQPPGDDPIGTTPGMPGQAPAGATCWVGQLPEVQPILPKKTVAEACATTSWSNDPIGNMATGDARAKLVGRWRTCGKGGIVPLSHDGIEFGANGRWRLLTLDASGALVPMTAIADQSVGRYVALASGQLNIGGETSGVPGAGFIKFSSDMDTFLIESFDSSQTMAQPTYARTDPSPTNGRDNLPSLTDGTCSMVGTWDLPANGSVAAATFSFDALGNFVGGPQGSDLCSGHTMYGTYRLAPGVFQLTSNVGMGLCSFWFDAGYSASFDASCTKLTTKPTYDNCTGGRGYFNQTNTIVKRP
jgi:hypothetical protein